ncbi:MAG: hypothetical protein KKC42_02420, partial [Candidatus Omnitrophica bacterium]|nr:hypothetical protein [Candidatus Omnitrophota bacterium]
SLKEYFTQLTGEQTTLLIYLLLVHEAKELSLVDGQTICADINTELAAFLTKAKAYYALSKEDREQLKDFAAKFDREARFIPWIELLDKYTSESLFDSKAQEEIASFLQQYKEFENQKMDEEGLKNFLSEFFFAEAKEKLSAFTVNKMSYISSAEIERILSIITFYVAQFHKATIGIHGTGYEITHSDILDFVEKIGLAEIKEFINNDLRKLKLFARKDVDIWELEAGAIWFEDFVLEGNKEYDIVALLLAIDKLRGRTPKYIKVCQDEKQTQVIGDRWPTSDPHYNSALTLDDLYAWFYMLKTNKNPLSQLVKDYFADESTNTINLTHELYARLQRLRNKPEIILGSGFVTVDPRTLKLETGDVVYQWEQGEMHIWIASEVSGDCIVSKLAGGNTAFWSLMLEDYIFKGAHELKIIPFNSLDKIEAESLPVLPQIQKPVLKAIEEGFEKFTKEVEKQIAHKSMPITADLRKVFGDDVELGKKILELAGFNTACVIIANNAAKLDILSNILMFLYHWSRDNNINTKEYEKVLGQDKVQVLIKILEEAKVGSSSPISSLLGRSKERVMVGEPFAKEPVTEEDLKDALDMLKSYSSYLYEFLMARISKDNYWYAPTQSMAGYARLQLLTNDIIFLLFDEFLKTLPKSRPKNILLFLLLVEETSHLVALPLKENYLTIELATFLNMAKAYYALSKEDREQLKDFAKEHKQGERLLPWLELMDRFTPKTILQPQSRQEMAEFITQNFKELFRNQFFDKSKTDGQLRLLELQNELAR